MGTLRAGGFKTCPKSCGECQGEPHHFSDALLGFSENDPEHEAAKLGIDTWWECKHCDTWIECGEDEEPDLSALATLPLPEDALKTMRQNIAKAGGDPDAVIERLKDPTFRTALNSLPTNKPFPASDGEAKAWGHEIARRMKAQKGR